MTPLAAILPCCEASLWCRWCSVVICPEHGGHAHDSMCRTCHLIYCTDPECDPTSEDR